MALYSRSQPTSKTMNVSERSLQFVIIVTLSALLVGCASLSGGRTDAFYCPYDTVWEETLLALHPSTFFLADEHNGVIETDWEKGMSQTKTGALGRSNLVQERSSIVVKIENDEKLTTVRVIHVRQHHHLEGTRSLRWLHAPALPAIEHRVLSRIHKRIKKRGCRAV